MTAPKQKHEKTKAGYQASEAEEHLKGMKKMVSFQVDEAWLTLEEAKKNQELAQEELKTAEEGRRLVKVRYEGALSPMVDLLDAQVSFDHARANRVARENEYKLAIANLCYASGTILAGFAAGRAEGEDKMKATNNRIQAAGKPDEGSSCRSWFCFLAAGLLLIGCGEKVGTGRRPGKTADDKRRIDRNACTPPR